MPSSIEGLILKHKRIGIILTLMLLIGGGVGILELGFTNNYRIFFSDSNPQLLDFDRFQETYGDQDNILIAIAPEDGDVFSKETLTVISEFTERSWSTPFSKRVDSITNYQHTYSQDDDLIVDSLVD